MEEDVWSIHRHQTSKKKEGDIPDTTPWKVLPLIPVWDKMSVPTYHKEFSRQHGESVLTDGRMSTA